MVEAIEELFEKEEFTLRDRRTLGLFLDQLDSGQIRAAEKINGRWRVNSWVKKGILVGFRMGTLVDRSVNDQFRYFDKDTYPLKSLTLDSGVRLVPGGSAIRRGAYVAPGVTCMPPMYINVGAYVEEGTMVDSHSLVGSCAQVGRRVHLSAGAQVGGVLEPVGALPVIIEEDVLVGGNCGIFEGTIVGKGAVVASGVTLTRATPVFDLVQEKIYRSERGRVLEIPSGAVVVPGARPVRTSFGEDQGLSVYTPVIVKYRDWKTDRSARLEEWLR